MEALLDQYPKWKTQTRGTCLPSYVHPAIFDALQQWLSKAKTLEGHKPEKLAYDPQTGIVKGAITLSVWASRTLSYFY